MGVRGAWGRPTQAANARAPIIAQRGNRTHHGQAMYPRWLHCEAGGRGGEGGQGVKGRKSGAETTEARREGAWAPKKA